MSEVFRIVKENITTRAAVIHYGMKPNRSNLICCPFHDDRNPSMKVDNRYFCFGCGASGDVIDFASNYFGLSLKDAANKLAVDFGFDLADIEKSSIHPMKSIPPSMKKQTVLKVDIEKDITQAFRTVMDYYSILKDWKEKYAPKSEDESWDEHFTEALAQWTRSEYLLDGLLLGSKDERKEFYEFYKEEVNRLGERVAEIEKSRNKRKPHR